MLVGSSQAFSDYNPFADSDQPNRGGQRSNLLRVSEKRGLRIRFVRTDYNGTMPEPVLEYTLMRADGQGEFVAVSDPFESVALSLRLSRIQEAQSERGDVQVRKVGPYFLFYRQHRPFLDVGELVLVETEKAVVE